MASYRNLSGFAVCLCRTTCDSSPSEPIGEIIMSAWYQEESFWRHGYPFMFSEEAFARGAQEAERALALSGVEARLVLDLCCGPGRHTVPLALKGIDVTAVDLSPFLLERAKENAGKANVTPEFVLADMRTFVRPDTFDVRIRWIACSVCCSTVFTGTARISPQRAASSSASVSARSVLCRRTYGRTYCTGNSRTRTPAIGSGVPNNAKCHTIP